jgi:predicted alpha/beta superfamily hydrolase
MLIILAIAPAGFMQAAAVPAAESPAPYVLENTFTHVITAEDRRDFTLYVAVPEGYGDASGKRYPVLYLLDGRVLFASTVMAYRAQTLGHRPVPLIIVGIDYAEKLSVMDWFSRRTTDFTPTNLPGEDQLFSQAYGQKTTTGRAASFRAALLECLIPFIETSYRTGSSRGLMGFSLGGLFAAHDLFQQDRGFDKYMLLSAALWWQDDAYILGLEEAFHAQGAPLEASVMISYGSREVADVTRPSDALADRLESRQYPALKLEKVSFPGEDHMSVVAASVSRAIQVMYVPPCGGCTLKQ